MSVDNLIKKFNKQFPVGAKVPWRSVKTRGEYTLLTVQKEAINHFGHPVCWFVEKSGCCSIEVGFVYYGKGEKEDDR